MNYKYNYKKLKKNSPLIIFIHGAGCDQTFWSLLNRYYFFRGYSTLAVNLPGHGDNNDRGLSSIDEMAIYVGRIVKKYSSKNTILIGHSMGSLVCLSILANKLVDVNKTILIGVAYPMFVSSSLLDLSKKDSKNAIINMIKWSLTSESKLRGSHLIGLNLPNLINTTMNKTENGILFNDLNACNKYLIEKSELEKINTSILIIAGKNDIMTPLKSSQNLNSLLKNSNIKTVDNCGHFHIHEKSNEVRRLISEYIEI
ncbi:MAG: putative aminoacrylate hydrolase RutD [Alphaproteobacteria bacterium MarineAlpha9_Bin4]|nr:hypothetical protein [Pelagibacterales bacterium]PPR26621.1 MAG: putative aminoacrylate hydrolase RutD [Alphaproteobacteria bacterium MarineAlpha9_Bin4]|tara:strand:- start:647 stop:1414 length:768 start_codon:yes stop_codon:yes gene_type:complete